MSGELWTKLKDKEYRDAYLVAKITNLLAYQVEALRRQRGWNQAELGRRAGKKQSVISRLEDPDYGRVNITTLFELASAFDVGLIVKFVPFSRFVTEYIDVSPQGLTAISFGDEDMALNAISNFSDWASVASDVSGYFIRRPNPVIGMKLERKVNQKNQDLKLAASAEGIFAGE